MSGESRRTRVRTRPDELHALPEDVPVAVLERANQARIVRGDLDLTEIADLARELADPATDAEADVALGLLCDSSRPTVERARQGARLILHQP